MSRYIDAEWVQDSLSLADECKDCRRNVDQCVHNTIDVGIVCNTIDDAPSIDIVHCINCKFCSGRGGHANCNGYLYCTRQKMLVDETCFCSWGKERQ